MPWARLVPAWLLTLLLVWAGPTQAHTVGAPATVTPVPGSAPSPAPQAVTSIDAASSGLPVLAWALLLVPASLPFVLRRRSRGTIAVELALVVAVFAVATAFHSVHHGPERAETATCPTAAAALQIVGTPLTLFALAAPAAALRGDALQLDLPALAGHLVDPLRGRAPPSARD